MSRITLNPIQQRLYLYRFAYVHLAPGLVLDHKSWNLSGLQCLQREREPGWRRALKACRPFSVSATTTVISPSLVALSRLRQEQPYRPLIYCRTAFEEPPRMNRLRRLVMRRPGTTEFLAPSDATRPIFWLCDRPREHGNKVAALNLFPQHPYLARAQILKRSRPSSDWLLREDGVAVEQLSLFDPIEHGHCGDAYSQECTLFDQSFRRDTTGRSGRTYVFAANAARLAWFRRDCRRLLPAGTFCWEFPQVPDPRDSLRHYILIVDKAVKHRRLESGLPCLHLDGTTQQHYYRNARLGRLSPASWFGKGDVVAWACMKPSRDDKVALIFQQGRDESAKVAWFSQDGSSLKGVGRIGDLCRRRAALSLIFPEGPELPGDHFLHEPN